MGASKELKEKIYLFDSRLDYSHEVWRDVIDFEGFYQVSNFGRVRSVDRIVRCKYESLKNHHGKILSQTISPLGYKTVHLSKYGRSSNGSVHRLVAQAFIKNTNNYPCINHIDEQPWNNCVENLEWCTYSYNNTYKGLSTKRHKSRSNSVANGTVQLGIPIVQLDLEYNLVKEWTNAQEVYRKIGLDPSAIRNVCNHGRKTSKGYIWMNKSEYLEKIK